MIQYARQSIDQSDIDAVVDALTSDYLAQGPVVPQFEKAISRRVAAKYAVATNSATSALHVSCMALGLGPGDLLWTVPNSFVASANCALLCGAEVDFVDIDAANYCMDPAKLAEKLIAAEKTGRLPKVLVVVHYSGRSADMKAISKTVAQYDIRIIEDAAHATGGNYSGNPIGCCEFSDVTVFSFHPVKIITSAEGGMAVTNDQNLANKISRIRSHGVTRNPFEMSTQVPLPWEYEQIDLGLNYRMTEIQAALGLSQVKRLNLFVERRRQLAQQYNHYLCNLPLILPTVHPVGESAWHLYPVLIDSKKTSQNREQIYFSLLKQGIKTNVHFIPIHTQPYFKKMGFRKGDFPVSEWFYANELSLPLYFGLTERQFHLVVNALKSSF